MSHNCRDIADNLTAAMEMQGLSPRCSYLGHMDRKQADKEKVELLNWAMSLCCTGMTPSMIRRELHNKIIDLQGSGEKA